MKVLVCGRRSDSIQASLFDTLDRIAGRLGITAVLQRGERGAEELALEWADRRNFRVEQMETASPAFRKCSSDFLRKRKGAVCPDLVVAFPGEARTSALVREAKSQGIAVIEMGDHLQGDQEMTGRPASLSTPRSRAKPAFVGRR